MPLLNELDKEDRTEFARSFVIAFICEFLGISIMMYIGCAGTYNLYNMGPTIPAFTFAFGILIALQTFGHISPCHINPCVTFGFFIMGKIGWKHMLVYFLAQYTGAFFGYALLFFTLPTTPSSRHNLCLLRVKIAKSEVVDLGFASQPYSENGIAIVQGIGIELIGSMCLLLTVCGCIHPKMRPLADCKYLKIVLVVGGIVFAIEPYTGAGLNSARAIPPAAFLNIWRNHYVYHIGPFLGMILAAVLYRFVLDDTHDYSLHTWLNKKGSFGEAES